MRKFLLETNFFFATNLVVALTRMVVNMYYLDTDSAEIFKTYFYNTVNIICAVLKMNSEKIFKDPDNISRITMCLEFLISNDFESFRQWIKESKDLFNEYYNNIISNSHKSSSSIKKKKVDVDEYISFRHVKPYDPDNFDTVEDDQGEETILDEKRKVLEEAGKKKNKFIEVLTGSDV